MKILVTGGTVFASRFTAEYFAEKGHEVYVLNRGSKPQSDGVKLIEADRHCLGNTLREHVFDAVLDVTAYNENDIADLLDGLGEFGQYIFVSSGAVYPETLSQPFKEEMQCGPNIYWGDYGTNKINAEKLLLEKVPHAYIIRPPYLYGKMNNLYREAFVFECAENNRKFYIPDDDRMPLQFFNIKNMCRFMEILLEKKPDRRIFNVGNPDTVTVDEWVRLCYDVLGKEAEICLINNIERHRMFPFRNYSYVLDVTEMLKLMDNLTPLSEGLKESYDWFVNNRELIIKKPFFEFIDDNLIQEIKNEQ